MSFEWGMPVGWVPDAPVPGEMRRLGTVDRMASQPRVWKAKEKKDPRNWTYHAPGPILDASGTHPAAEVRTPLAPYPAAAASILKAPPPPPRRSARNKKM
jgi:hypothetical protein